MSEEEQRVPEEPQETLLEEEAVAGDNYGFRPLEPEQKEERREDVKKDTPATKLLRQNINRMLCRFPQLKLRTSISTMRELEKYDEEELHNILTNAQNDLATLRGAPMADCLVFLTAGLVDRYALPGYLERCMADEELKQDVEAEATLMFGVCGNRANIAFRLLNNAFTQIVQPETPLFGEQYEDFQNVQSNLEPRDGEGTYFRTVIGAERQGESEAQRSDQRAGSGGRSRATPDASDRGR